MSSFDTGLQEKSNDFGNRTNYSGSQASITDRVGEPAGRTLQRGAGVRRLTERIPIAKTPLGIKAKYVEIRPCHKMCYFIAGDYLYGKIAVLVSV